MQLLSIGKNTTLIELGRQVGKTSVDHILNANTLLRTPDVGNKFYEATNNIIQTHSEVGWQRKTSILNSLTSDADIFETAALMGENDWKVMSALGTTTGRLKIPESITIPDSNQVIGNGQPINSRIYTQAMQMLETYPHRIDPIIFNDYSSSQAARIIDAGQTSNAYEWLGIPWGQITLHSSIADEHMDIPVYPQELADERTANYITMPDTMYQYEPWYVYSSSGPRTVTLKFTMHRDMWTGNHNDGNCNKLIRFCEANCFPDYKGSSVHTARSTLYIAGQVYISGIITSVAKELSGPLGHDLTPLYVEMSLTFSEVSKKPLNYNEVRKKGLIG